MIGAVLALAAIAGDGVGTAPPDAPKPRRRRGRYYDPGQQPAPRRPVDSGAARGARPGRIGKAKRRELCALAGVKNTGRQWRKLRKGLRRGVAGEGART
jgi:hypothetical protein